MVADFRTRESVSASRSEVCRAIGALRSGLAAADEPTRAGDRETDGREPGDERADTEGDAADRDIGGAAEGEKAAGEAARLAAERDPAADHRERGEYHHADQVLHDPQPERRLGRQ